MGRFDKLKETFNKSVDSVKNSAQNLAESVKEVDLKEIAGNVKNKAEEITNSAKEMNAEKLKDSMKEMGKKAATAVMEFQKNSKETDRAAKEALKETESEEFLVTNEDALKLVYLLMSVDKSISSVEVEKFNSIAMDMTDNNADMKNAVVVSCAKNLKGIEEEDHYDTVRDMVSEALRHSKECKEGTIQPKVLLWNLLTIAYSDASYPEEEKKIIRYISKTLGIDKSIAPEMESAIHTMIAIENEEITLKNSDKKYSLIEAELNELTDRKTVIMNGVHELLLD